MRRLKQTSILFIAIGILISCGSDNSSSGPDTDTDPEAGDSTGIIEITTSTTGDNNDQDGYTVKIGKEEKDISANETISVSDLEEGDHVIELMDIAENCDVDGDNPRTVIVTEGETTSTVFEIKCKEVQPVSEQKAIDAVKQVMQNKGWTTSVNTTEATITGESDPTLLDYIATDVTDEGTRQVYMLIGPDGHLIPTSEWQENNQYKCKEESLRYMKVAEKRFNFKLFSLADGYDVFAQYIDIATGKIEGQREGQSSSLVDAINTAWNKIQRPVKEPTDPCGEKISNLTLTFSATTSLENIPKDAPNYSTTSDEQVEAEVQLTFNEQDSIYEGTGDLKWANYNYSPADCELPDNATIKVHKFVYGNPENPEEETELQLQFRDMPQDITCVEGNDSYDIWADFSFSWWLLHEDEIHKKVDLDGLSATIEYIYALHNWESVEVSPVIIVQKEYDHSRKLEDEDFINNISGESMIRILHE